MSAGASARPAEVLDRPLGAERPTGGLSLFVAMGDSFTAGTGCAPGEAWPERLAARLRPANPKLGFRNLAVHGASSGEVVAQLPAALGLEPDLVTIVCGANDVLRSTRPDADAYSRRLAAMIERLQDADPAIRILTATAPERWDFLGLGPRTRARVERGIARFNAATREIARRSGVPCLDVAGHAGLSLAENFADDGLHPSALGHERAARGFAGLIAISFAIETEAEPEGERR